MQNRTIKKLREWFDSYQMTNILVDQAHPGYSGWYDKDHVKDQQTWATHFYTITIWKKLTRDIQGTYMYNKPGRT